MIFAKPQKQQQTEKRDEQNKIPFYHYCVNWSIVFC